MPTVADVLHEVHRLAPPELAFEWDRIGLQVGNPNAEVKRGMTCLDPSAAVCSKDVQVIIGHHPLIWDPLRTVIAGDRVSDLVLRLARKGCAYIAAHTNWDCAQGGVNDVLADLLGLQDLATFGSGQAIEQLKVVTFVPEDAVQKCIDAVSDAGAGVIKNYTRCAFMTPGKGTFIPGKGSDPAIGQPGKPETTSEIRLEMVLSSSDRKRVEAAIRESHPYEEPAIDFFTTTLSPQYPCGRVGSLAKPMLLGDFIVFVNQKLSTKCEAWGDDTREIHSVGVVGGAADGEWSAAYAAGADVFITGEVKQSTALEASERGIAILAAGHFATENPAMKKIAVELGKALPEIEWEFFEPKPGEGGRPL